MERGQGANEPSAGSLPSSGGRIVTKIRDTPSHHMASLKCNDTQWVHMRTFRRIPKRNPDADRQPSRSLI